MWTRLRENLFFLLAILLWGPAFFIPNYLAESQHNPPVGVYIAIMGPVAAAVTFRKEPCKKEKAAWILLMTLLMFAEIRNLYVADADQLAKFERISDALDVTQRGLNAAARGIDESAAVLKVLAEQSTKISSGIGNVANLQIGGDSFCFFSFVPGNTAPPAINIGVQQEGRYPLRSVSANMWDSKQMNEVMTGKRGPSKGIPNLNFFVGDLAKGAFKNFARYDSSADELTGDKLRFDIMFNALNGGWFETALLRKVNGRWTQAIQVRFEPLKKKNFEMVDKDYPRVNGKVDWSVGNSSADWD